MRKKLTVITLISGILTTVGIFGCLTGETPPVHHPITFSPYIGLTGSILVLVGAFLALNLAPEDYKILTEEAVLRRWPKLLAIALLLLTGGTLAVTSAILVFAYFLVVEVALGGASFMFRFGFFLYIIGSILVWWSIFKQLPMRAKKK
jgi:hypothetical protein